MFLLGFPDPQEQAIRGSLSTHRGDVWRTQAEDYLSTQTGQSGPNNHRVASMKQRKKKNGRRLSEEEIDKIVESQADDDSAWEQRIEVRRDKKEPLTITE